MKNSILPKSKVVFAWVKSIKFITLRLLLGSQGFKWLQSLRYCFDDHIYCVNMNINVALGRQRQVNWKNEESLLERMFCTCQRLHDFQLVVRLLYDLTEISKAKASVKVKKFKNAKILKSRIGIFTNDLFLLFYYLPIYSSI